MDSVHMLSLRHRRTALAVLLLSTAIGGCSVKPESLSEQEHQQRADDLLKRVAAQQEPVTAPIDLYSAMARAIKYNLDYRVEMMEHAVRVRELDLSRYDMLPRLVGTLDYNGRSNDSGGSSRSLLTGQQSLEPSTSSDREVLASDLALSWDVLDFGLSYVRAQQAGDAVMLAEERKRKVIQRIVEDVRTAFWRAACAERMLGKTLELERTTEAALKQAEEQESSGLTRPLVALSYERELLTISRDVQSLARELGVAKQQLAGLMNLEPGQDYSIKFPAEPKEWKSIDQPYSQMLRLAVENRPELREVAYQMRSNERETTATLLRALPNLKLFVGANVNDNSYLYNSSWTGWGAQASWNLLNVFRYGADRDRIDAQAQLLDERALALTMAVATQLSVSQARYELRKRELNTAERYLRVQRKIEAQIDAGYRAESVSQQTLIREQMNSVVAEVRMDMALADLQNAYANVYASIGIDPIDPTMSSADSVDVLAGKLRRLWAGRGDALAQVEAL